jgi:cobyrinic acid a,c-diamide synthase
VSARGLLIAGQRSGAGKTTLTVGLLAAFKRRGSRVRGAKAGPDYIDPAFHQAACGSPSLNLDSWAMPPSLLDAIASDATSGIDLLLVESAMGLFDGIAGAEGRTGSAADLAARFNIPVLLVLDVSGQAQTAAAVAHGLARFDPRIRIAGIILNRLGSDRHRGLIAEAFARLSIPLLGALPRADGIALPERHLGLVQAGEHGDLQARVQTLADLVEDHCDLDGIEAISAPLALRPRAPAIALPPPGQRIALAQDAAFTFVYPHLVKGWARAGAEIVTFSPLADETPPETCDACWLPGGYPELHAGPLADAASFKQGIARFAETRPVHGECGGYMVLGEGLETSDGTRHAMTGLLSHATSFAKRRLHLGYRDATLLGACALGEARATLRGHEFHYASLIDPGRDGALAELRDGEGKPLGKAGGRRGSVTGSFFHVIATGEAVRPEKRPAKAEASA